MNSDSEIMNSDSEIMNSDSEIMNSDSEIMNSELFVSFPEIMNSDSEILSLPGTTQTHPTPTTPCLINLYQELSNAKTY